MKIRNTTIPPVGMRIIKSALGVFLGFVIYILRGRQGAPFYTALSVLWCMQPYSSNAKANAMQRTIGTLIGAFFGLIVILVELNIFQHRSEILSYMMISLMIIPVIYMTVLINKKNASYFSCVVFLSIVVIHLTDENPYLFVLTRVIDTMIGIVLALVINLAKIPRKRKNDTLFIAELDKIFLKNKEKLTPYSKVELNRMLESGLKFTISTVRTPATLLEELGDVKLNIPIITMDGAVLFDVNKNRYLKVYDLSNNEAKEVINLLKQNNINTFVNTVVEDSVIIYYTDLKNEAEKEIYETLRVSPYRNYIREELPEKYGAAYIMAIDKSENINNIYEILKNNQYLEKFKILTYPSADFKGYSYLKIYNKDATKENMLNYIEEIANVKEVVNIESNKNEINIKYGSNEMVSKLKEAYEPFFFKK